MAHGGIHAQLGAEKGFLHAESFSPTPSPAEQHAQYSSSRRTRMITGIKTIECADTIIKMRKGLKVKADVQPA